MLWKTESNMFMDGRFKSQVVGGRDTNVQSPFCHFMRRGTALSKGKVAFSSPIHLGFASTAPLLRAWWSLCGFCIGLLVAAVVFVVWILLQ